MKKEENFCLNTTHTPIVRIFWVGILDNIAPPPPAWNCAAADTSQHHQQSCRYLNHMRRSRNRERNNGSSFIAVSFCVCGVAYGERTAVCYDFAMAMHRLVLNSDEHPFFVNSIQRKRLDRDWRLLCLLWTLYGQPACFLAVDIPYFLT